MTYHSLPHFGELDPKNLKDYYHVYINLNGQDIQIDLNFENNSV